MTDLRDLEIKKFDKDEIHLMVDIETLDVAPNSTVLTLGLVQFNPYDITKEPFNPLYLKLEYKASQANRSISEGTLIFWNEQPEKIKNENLYGERKDLKEALSELVSYLKNNEFSEIWGQGYGFDMTILADLLLENGFEVPWKYYQQRDSRTLTKILNQDARGEESKEELHNALNDAYYQALAVQRTFDVLIKLRELSKATLTRTDTNKMEDDEFSNIRIKYREPEQRLHAFGTDDYPLVPEFITSPSITVAMSLAKEYHKGQKYGDFDYYDKHLRNVALRVLSVSTGTPKEIEGNIIVAWLHDILEDTNIELSKLKELFPEDLVHSIQLLTREDGQSNEEYLSKIKTNKRALLVKIEDTKENLNSSEISNDKVRIKKYSNQLRFLQNS